MDFLKYRSEEVIPRPDSMIETFGALGYSLSTAIADIIDNSIAAGAKTVWIDFKWEEEKSCVLIRDDGKGMSSEELVEAMRPGSRNPLEERDARDLGRFGLGLKTASFSQCRRLTVISKKPGCGISYRCWDLDYVNEVKKWLLLEYISDESWKDLLDTQESGTVVIWEKPVRLTGRNNSSTSIDKKNAGMQEFISHAQEVKKNLSLIFHRFLEQKKLIIIINQDSLLPWNPFLKGHNGTQKLSESSLDNGDVIVAPYVLPHQSKFSDRTEFEQAGGLHGWNAHQGFYIYRNERLLVAGDWLGMFRKEEHYKLARIMVDIPNRFDYDWQLDIKKATVKLPSRIRKELENVAKTTRVRAVEVYRHRGKTIQRREGSRFVMMWNERIRNEKKHYEINREHPLIAEFADSCSTPRLFSSILALIEETLPVPLIVLNENQTSHAHGVPFENFRQEDILESIRFIYNHLLSQGYSEEKAREELSRLEPFNYFPELIKQL